MRFIPTSGTPVANLSIAVGTGRKDKQGNEITDFIPVRAYGKTAENCSNYLSKGSLIAVQGSMKVDKYVKEDGEKRTFAYVNANRVQFLQTKKNENNHNTNSTDENIFNPAFGLDPNEFMAIDDGDAPF
jgi:single-strand DNA-binding protein